MDGIIAWAVIGVVIGTFAKFIFKNNNNGIGLWTDIILGASGGIVGGLSMSLIRGMISSGFYSILAGLVGSIIFVWFGRVFFR